MWKNLQNLFDSSESYISTLLGLGVVLALGMLIYTYTAKKQAQPGTAGDTKQEAQKAKVKLPATHVVQAGETLWKIALDYYESGYNWVSIAAANALANPDYIVPEQKLTIPDVPAIKEGQASSMSTEVASTEIKKYTVVHDDSLWTIAQSQYQDPYRWTDIARTNKLVHPDLIYPGDILALP